MAIVGLLSKSEFGPALHTGLKDNGFAVVDIDPASITESHADLILLDLHQYTLANGEPTAVEIIQAIRNNEILKAVKASETTETEVPVRHIPIAVISAPPLRPGWAKELVTAGVDAVLPVAFPRVLDNLYALLNEKVFTEDYLKFNQTRKLDLLLGAFRTFNGTIPAGPKEGFVKSLVEAGTTEASIQSAVHGARLELI